MLFDSHCHLTDERLRDDTDGLLERAREAGVVRVVTIASDEDDAVAALDLARGRDGVWSTAGIHPHRADRATARALARVAELLEDADVVAVGETGLDYHYDNAPRDRQRRAFAEQLALAAEHRLPAVVHSRKAEEDTIALIREFAGEVRGVLHCFSSGSAVLDAGIEADWWISFSGLVTFDRFDGRGLVAAVPPGRLLVETDSPYLAPVPHRGKRNEPAFVRHVVAAIADILAEPAEEVGRRTSENALRFYGLEAGAGLVEP